jgi:pimeloyl-ACP methyl ester carboxylesterase
MCLHARPAGRQSADRDYKMTDDTRVTAHGFVRGKLPGFAAKPLRGRDVTWAVPHAGRKITMISIVLVAVLVALALLTQAGIFVLDRTYPPRGVRIDVAGAALNVVDLGRRDVDAAPIVLLHGASSNLEVMRPLAERLAADHRVILIDRPGHGGSTRERLEDSTPQVQARMIVEALDKLGVGSAIVVVHSLAGAIGARMALDYPTRVAGLVMLAPVTHPWRGGVGWYNRIVSRPLIGPLLAWTVTLPIGLVVTQSGARGVFAPQAMADDFVESSATLLLLRPREFLANARDLVDLKEAVAEQAPRYGEIDLPVTIISGDENDKTVSTNIHSRPLAATVKGTKLIVLQGVGHMVQYAAPDLVVSEIEAMTGRIGQGAAKVVHG